ARVVEVAQKLAAEPGMPDGILGIEATGGVRQDRVSLQIEKVEDVASLFIDETLAADRDGGDLAGARGQAIAHQVIAGVLPGTGDEPALEGELADDERFVGGRSRGRGAAADEGDDFDVIAVGKT